MTKCIGECKFYMLCRAFQMIEDLSWTPGNPCDVCDNKKECSEKYLSTHPTIESARINTCEYEKRWETICRSQVLTDPKDSVHYVSYSCALCFCRYPERECNVKKVTL